MKVFIISGLGADERAFSKIEYPDNWDVTYFQWIIPNQDESLDNYLEQMFKQHGNEWDIIVGLSFGGILAQEYVKKYCSESIKVILISSAVEAKQIPFRRFLLSIVSLLPDSMITWPNPLLRYLFGVKSNEALVVWKNIIKDTNPQVIRWAVNIMKNWNGSEIYNLKMINGINDRMIKSLKSDNSTNVVGGHFMIYENAIEVSKWLQSIQHKKQL